MSEDKKDLKNMQEETDAKALWLFRAQKAAIYFNETAKKTMTPDKIEMGFYAYADALKHSAAQKEYEAAQCRILEEYEASRIAEFVAAQPEVWQRLAKTDDEFVAKAKKYLNSSL